MNGWRFKEVLRIGAEDEGNQVPTQIGRNLIPVFWKWIYRQPQNESVPFCLKTFV